MKISTMTFHKTLNFGALLQTYALQKTLAKLGHESEVIDYHFAECMTYVEWQVQLKVLLKKLLSLLFKKYMSERLPQELRILNTLRFIAQHIPISKKAYKSLNELNEIAGYDAFICGSDQVWNPNYLSADAAMRLEFVPKGCRRISYAASFGISELPAELWDTYRKALQKFDSISVREESGRKIVRDVANREAEVVMDPTLLLTKEEWSTLLKPTKQITGKYIFCYFLGDWDEAKTTISTLQAKHQMPIYAIGSEFADKSVTTVLDAGPIEFLQLIANSSFMVTNSFHGMVFSILFQKQFLAIVGDDRAAIGSRLHDLAIKLGLQDRIYTNGMSLEDKSIDYTAVETVLIKEREKSIQYLKQSLSP